MHEMGRWQKDSAEDPRYYIRGSALAGFAELVTAAGGDPAALLEKAGFSPEVPALQDELVSWTRLCLLLERAAETLDRPSLGIEWALSVPDHFPNVGPTLLLANFAGTFQEWIEASITCWRHHTNAFALQLVDDGPGHDAVFRHVLLSPALPMRQHAEYMLGNACRMARATGGLIHRNPSQVRFRHQKPADTSLHEAIFGCPVTFGASHDDIVFDRRLLSLPLRGTPGRLRKVMDLHIRHRWRQMPLRDDTMATTVGLAIRSVMGTKLCSCGLVAGSLGLSAKKLQRLLSHEGTSFSAILDDVRRAMAVRLLSDTEAPISRIAGLLAYSTPGPFTLAFKRWTGVSPRVFRKRLPASSPCEGT